MTTRQTAANAGTCRATRLRARGTPSFSFIDTMTSVPEDTPLSDSEYHARAAAVLAAVEAAADRWLQQDVVDVDTQRTGGMLELSFPNDSKIVLNTQPPLHELWMAARRGGYHYKYQRGRWCDMRDGSEFFAALSACASEQAGVALVFEARQG